MNNVVGLLLKNSAVFSFKLLNKSCVTINTSTRFYNKFSFGLPSEMAQRSITSFFKSTPKKTEEQLADKSITEDNVSTKVKAKQDPPKEEKPARTSKRSRSSSEENCSPTESKSRSVSPVTSASKKKVKRQRIESSSSEGGPSSPQSPKLNDITVKFETENKQIKTYASPKSKKVKVKQEKKTPDSKLKDKSPIKTKEVKSEKIKSPKKSPAAVVKKATSPVLKQEKDEKVTVNDEGQVVPENEYNPSKPKYHPINDACWAKDQEVPYLALAKTFECIEAITARLKIVEILSNYFRSVLVLTPEDLLPSVYMCLNQLAPAYHSLELGIAETYLMKAVGQCTGRSLTQVKAATHKAGDLGIVAEQARATQRMMFTPPPLKLRKVFASLKEIAHMTGQASVNKKISKIQTLYVACRHSEAKYLIRSLEGKLRIGLAEQSVLQALAQACTATPPPYNHNNMLDASKGLTQEQFKAKIDATALTIKSTYCECPNYDMMIPVLLTEGVEMLPKRCVLTPGIPLKPMLAHPTKGVHEVFNRFENELFTCEYKYDGERAQIHVPCLAGEEKADLANAKIFSRNQENNTSKYPDILRRLPSLLKPSVHSCVLDCEAVAYDVVNKQIQPFQVLSTRKRKDANESEIKVQVCVFVFDLLYLNGVPLVKQPLQHRRDLLREHFNTVEGEWQFAMGRDCSSTEEVQQLLEEAVRGSCEGLMVKSLRGATAHYDIARRSHNWLKLKKDYLEGVGDTVDVIVIGGYLGKGKRAGVYGGFLLACYDSDTEEFQSLCKIGTGFSDHQLQEFSDHLNQHLIDAPRSYYRFDSSLSPDAWFSGRVVWEVRCADLSLSPVHRAALSLIHNDKGVSLRFPRFVRVRDDKTAEQATSARQIADLYLAQDQVKNQTNKQPQQDDFY